MQALPVSRAGGTRRYRVFSRREQRVWFGWSFDVPGSATDRVGAYPARDSECYWPGQLAMEQAALKWASAWQAGPAAFSSATFGSPLRLNCRRDPVIPAQPAFHVRE
jgi:hypothetical protein